MLPPAHDALTANLTRAILRALADALAAAAETIAVPTEIRFRSTADRPGQSLRAIVVPTVADAANELLVAKARAGRRDRYLVELRHSLALFVTAHGERPLTAVRAEDVEAWLTRPNWSQRTRRNHLTDVATLFNWCVRRGWLARSPCASIEKPVVDAKPPGIHTPAQVATLLRTALAMDRDVARILALQYFAGIRPAEVLRLTEANLLPHHVEVGAQQAKTRQRRLCTRTEALNAWLTVSGRLPVKNFVRRWRAVREAADVAWSNDVARHSFATYHLAHFGSADKTAQELGHAGGQMLWRHYREIVTPAVAAEFWEIRPEKRTAGP